MVARVAEILTQYQANIVRLNSEKVPGPEGDVYAVRIAVWLPPARARACLATLANTAGELRLSCDWEEAEVDN